MGATVRNLDFTGVKEQSGINPKRKPEGEYLAKIVAVDDHKSKEGNDSWVFTIQLADDKRATYAYYCGVDEKQLWKIRGLFIAAGIGVPKKRVKVDPNKLLNKMIGIILEDDEYDGRVKSTINGVIPVADLDDQADEDVDDTDDEDDEPEEKPAPRKRASKKAPEPEPDEDDEEDDEEDEAPPPPKKRRAKKAPEPEPEDDEDDEEDEEPAPAPKKRARKAAAAPAKKKAAPVEDDEDDDLDLDEL